jgi:hypothetical protein
MLKHFGEKQAQSYKTPVKLVLLEEWVGGSGCWSRGIFVALGMSLLILSSDE